MLLEVDEADEGGDERLADMVMGREGGEGKGEIGVVSRTSGAQLSLGAC